MRLLPIKPESGIDGGQAHTHPCERILTQHDPNLTETGNTRIRTTRIVS